MSGAYRAVGRYQATATREPAPSPLAPTTPSIVIVCSIPDTRRAVTTSRPSSTIRAESNLHVTAFAPYDDAGSRIDTLGERDSQLAFAQHRHIPHTRGLRRRFRPQCARLDPRPDGRDFGHGERGALQRHTGTKTPRPVGSTPSNFHTSKLLSGSPTTACGPFRLKVGSNSES